MTSIREARDVEHSMLGAGVQPDLPGSWPKIGHCLPVIRLKATPPPRRRLEGIIGAVHVRVCVDCKEEYRPEVARCADCGGALEDRHDDESPDRGSLFAHLSVDSDRSLPDAHALATSADARELVPLADRLVEAGVEFRIVSREVAGEERPRGFELRVTDADRGAALQLAAGLVGPASGVTLLAVWVPEASDEAQAALHCPACDTPVGVSATECPECGLGLEGEREA